MSCAELDSDGVEPITDAELSELPIFPLPQCVLLPGGLLPLHVFEPRYRELTKYCLEGNRPMGVARLVPQRLARSSGSRQALKSPIAGTSASSPTSTSAPVSTAEYVAELTAALKGDPAALARRPAVFPHLGVGRIICSEELEDGRFLILLRGVARVKIEHELPDLPGLAGEPGNPKSFRRVQASRLDDGQADPDAVRHLHHQLMAICDRLAMVLDEGGRQLRELAYGSVPGACADAVAAALMMDADERQALLEQTCPRARLTAALSHVSKLLCQVVPCDDVVN